MPELEQDMSDKEMIMKLITLISTSSICQCGMLYVQLTHTSNLQINRAMNYEHNEVYDIVWFFSFCFFIVPH